MHDLSDSRSIVSEIDIMRLTLSHGLPLASLVIEVGAGAGAFLLSRIRQDWWQQTRHIAIDPLPVYAGQGGILSVFGMIWVSALAGASTQSAQKFIHDPAQMNGYVPSEQTPIPMGWVHTQYPVTTIDDQLRLYRRTGDQSIWLRIDCLDGVMDILAGASETLARADLVSIVLNLDGDPDLLGCVFTPLEQSGLRCYRFGDLLFDPDTGMLLMLTVIFVRLEHMPEGLAGLSSANIESTYQGLAERHAENLSRIDQMVTRLAVDAS